MMNNLTVSIYTQVYNTKQFLSRCIESVLNQTFRNFEYILIDNASTDGSRELMQEYAARDSRIKIIYIEKNTPSVWLQVAKETAKGQYISELDSDDWLESDFLERMVFLTQKHQLDIACTGSVSHIEGKENAEAGTRSLPEQLIIERPEYALYLSYYHAFFRTIWGKLIRRDIFMLAEAPIIDCEKIKNGADTIWAFSWLRLANRICVDNSVLHHYLVRPKSYSRIYLPNRFKSNTVLHQDALDFLSPYGPVSKKNLLFLHRVYVNAVADTLEVLWSSDLSPEEKLTEYCTIALHPFTREAYQDTHEEIERSRNILLRQILAVAAEAESAPETFPHVMQALFPRCGQAFTASSRALFQREPKLMDALCRDDWDGLVEGLMHLIVEKRYTKQFDLSMILHFLIPRENPLCSVSDIHFFQQYAEISLLLLCENYPAALGEMTELLLERQKLSESFLRLYLVLASRQREEGAFLFGMIRLARELLRQKRVEEAASIVKELEEMGIEENSELAGLRNKLKEDT